MVSETSETMKQVNLGCGYTILSLWLVDNFEILPLKASKYSVNLYTNTKTNHITLAALSMCLHVYMFIMVLFWCTKRNSVYLLCTTNLSNMSWLTLQVRRATIVAWGIYSRSASGDYSSPSEEVTVYFH